MQITYLFNTFSHYRYNFNSYYLNLAFRLAIYHYTYYLKKVLQDFYLENMIYYFFKIISLKISVSLNIHKVIGGMGINVDYLLSLI